MNNYRINILHLYPDLLNLYGDKGNIECMKKRLEWRGIDAFVNVCTANDEFSIGDNVIIFLGGGSDRENETVRKLLLEKKEELKNFVESDGTLVAVCGGFPILGKTCKIDNEVTEGLGILDITTETNTKEPRLIGNVVLECDGIKQKVVGFENHGCKTDIGDLKPLGRVLKGYGNNGKSGIEGVIYKNLIGTYLHGPIFPKNPQLCDRVLLGALKKKYNDFGELAPLDDSLEILANEYMERRI